MKDDANKMLADMNAAFSRHDAIFSRPTVDCAAARVADKQGQSIKAKLTDMGYDLVFDKFGKAKFGSLSPKEPSVEQS